MTFTHEQIRAAILRAATCVEFTNYNFFSSKVGECGSPMCMWGWIGSELGIPKGASISHVFEPLGLTDRSLYDMARGCVSDQVAASNGMRAFADKYFPAPITNSTTIRQPVVSWESVMQQTGWAPSAEKAS
jgi:hypothetical protein